MHFEFSYFSSGTLGTDAEFSALGRKKNTILHRWIFPSWSQRGKTGVNPSDLQHHHPLLPSLPQTLPHWELLWYLKMTCCLQSQRCFLTLEFYAILPEYRSKWWLTTTGPHPEWLTSNTSQGRSLHSPWLTENSWNLNLTRSRISHSSPTHCLPWGSPTEIKSPLGEHLDHSKTRF